MAQEAALHISMHCTLQKKWVVYNHWTGLVDWTGGLDWWTDLKIIFILANENSPVWLHLET